MRVGILTTFADLHESYSLIGVVLDQCGMLRQQGVDFALFVNEPGPRLNTQSMNSVEWIQPFLRREVPTGDLREDVIDDDLRQRTANWLRGICQEFDVLVTHDWAFTTWNVSYNQAMRDVAEEFPGVTWVHWVHSAPGDRPNRLLGAQALRYTIMPNSLYVYLNFAHRIRYAESLGTDVSKISVCYNPMDAAAFLGCGAEATTFIHEHRLWDREIMQVYPISMPRAAAKGLDKLIGIFGEWKRLGYRVKLVVVNAHCNAPAEQKFAESYRLMAREDWNLTESDLVFTSDRPGWEYTVPHDVVSQLFRLSNVFVFPTVSEACSRVLQEASLAGCMVVGNDSFSPMHEFLDPSVPRFTFGALGVNVEYPLGKDQWLREVAKALTPYLEHPMFRQQSHMLRLSAWETIWREQFQPILRRAVAMTEERRAA